jgi:hypothetical protein
MRILYELLRYANTHESLEELLSVVAFSTLRVFEPWGVSAWRKIGLAQSLALDSSGHTSSK